MANKELKQVSSSSLDIKEQNIERLKELFPDVITENKIDFDKLRLLLGDAVEVTKERYNFTWNGKTQAIQLVQKPTTSTLKPSKDKSKNWDETQNLYVEGDNLEVLKVLQKSYANKVRMIYLDPPYNTGRDFVYSDNFSDSLKNYKRLTGQVDDEGKSLITSVETGGRIHSKWLNMMYPRLVLARNLLKDEGVIFISIDEHEVSNLSKLCDEIFGEENCLGIAARVTKKSNNKGDYWAPNFDYILTYGKNRKQTPPFSGEANTKAYNLLDKTGPRKGEPYQLVRLYMSSIHNNNPEQRFYITAPDGEKLLPPGETRPPQSPKISDGIWRWTRKTFEKNLSEGKIVIKKVKSSNLINENGEPAHWNVFTKTYLSDVEDKNSAKPNSLIENHINQIASQELNALDIPFDYAKPVSLIKYLMKVAGIVDDDIVLDFFSGSGTTGEATMQYNLENSVNCRYFLIQLPERTGERSAARNEGFQTIPEIAEERLIRAGNKLINENPESASKIDIGFKVFELEKSNLKKWNVEPENLNSQLDLLASNFEKDSKSIDIVYEIMLKQGLDLNYPINETTVGESVIYDIAFGAMFVVLGDTITSDVAGYIIKKIQDEKAENSVVVLQDEKFVNDSEKLNMIEQLNASGIQYNDILSV